MPKKEHKNYQIVVKNPPKGEQVVRLEKWKYYVALVIILLLSFIAYSSGLKNGFTILVQISFPISS